MVMPKDQLGFDATPEEPGTEDKVINDKVTSSRQGAWEVSSDSDGSGASAGREASTSTKNMLRAANDEMEKPEVEEELQGAVALPVSANDMKETPEIEGELQGAVGLPVSDDDDPFYANFDPMMDDYLNDIGMSDIYPALAGFSFNERRIGDVPCQFHDGVSEYCWKGPSCPYGHKKYTGGRFARRYPELAMQAAASKEVTCINKLPDKQKLNVQMEFKCQVTHVNNPGDFYVKPISEGPVVCQCKSLEEKITQLRLIEQKKKEEQEKAEMDPMEGYFFGHHAVEPQEGLGDREEPDLLIPLPSKSTGPSLEDRMNNYLNRGLNYMRYQKGFYQYKVELVAVRINNRWKRAVTLYSGQREEQAKQVRVQLLDTGEKHTVMLRDVCRLPLKYVHEPAAVFKGMLYRVSPIYSIYPSMVTNFFKQLVEGKELRAIVKGGVDEQPGAVHGIEPVPYYFKLMFGPNENGEWVDVAQQLIDEGMVMEWNPFPYRPFATSLGLSTKGLDFLNLPPMQVEKKVLEKEIERLVRGMGLDDDKKEGDCDSDDSSDTDWAELEKIWVRKNIEKGGCGGDKSSPRAISGGAKNVSSRVSVASGESVGGSVTSGNSVRGSIGSDFSVGNIPGDGISDAGHGSGLLDL